MTELLFNKRLQVLVKSRDTNERRSVIRIGIELQSTSNPVHRSVQFNSMSIKPSTEVGIGSPTTQPFDKENGEHAGSDSKYFERRDDSIPL